VAPRPDRRTPKRGISPLHARRITEVDGKDTALLRTFVSDRGRIRERRGTSLSLQQRCQVATAIRDAREMALLPHPRSARG
jgi:small subunit ribosomal protein S18